MTGASEITGKLNDNGDRYILEMIGITKEFPGVKALDGVTFRVRPGTVHSLMGENGSGEIDSDEMPFRYVQEGQR